MLGSPPDLLNYLLVGFFGGEGNGSPLQYSCLENPMDGGAWWATVHGVTKSQTQLSDSATTGFFGPQNVTFGMHPLQSRVSSQDL